MWDARSYGTCEYRYQTSAIVYVGLYPNVSTSGFSLARGLTSFRMITRCVRTFNLAYHLVGVRKWFVVFVTLCELFMSSVLAILGIERHRVFVQGYACLFYINPYMKVCVRSCKCIIIFNTERLRWLLPEYVWSTWWMVIYEQLIRSSHNDGRYNRELRH